MNEYILLEIECLTLKNADKYKDYVGKTFTMQDVLHLNERITLDFNGTPIKCKFQSICKDGELDEDKRFCLLTKEFVAIIQLVQDDKKEE